MSSRPQIHVPAVRSETEKSLGIIQRVSPINFSWTGDIRKRYILFPFSSLHYYGARSVLACILFTDLLTT